MIEKRQCPQLNVFFRDRKAERVFFMLFEKKRIVIGKYLTVGVCL